MLFCALTIAALATKLPTLADEPALMRLPAKLVLTVAAWVLPLWLMLPSSRKSTLDDMEEPLMLPKKLLPWLTCTLLINKSATVAVEPARM